ncbi:HAAS signaling domain-containing protein [Cellulomonas soli]|uniref:HAAS signaling domain-containing protein n=1 Tax=Cellulomonas soli TaxID=931535 RepID=UPI0011BE4845|nr:hypothetical protein [Cellulomonas soli]NYI59895.1 hypothetical protein [Cellulomonas soli]
MTEYLRRLGQASAHAPIDRRETLFGEVAEHLRATVPLNATDEYARRLLSEFGSPEDLAAEAFGMAAGPEPASRHRWLRPGGAVAVVVAAAGAAIALAVTGSTASTDETTVGTPAVDVSAVTPPAVALLQPGPRTTEGRAYAEYAREIDSLPALPEGVDYPDGVPPQLEPTEPVVAETGIGAVVADFTWLCIWESEYLDAYDADAFERVLDAEQALRSWGDFTPLPPEDFEGWSRNVLTPLQFDDPSGVRADRLQACNQAGIRVP